jgi:choline dehydrogenase-like flavoprotein
MPNIIGGNTAAPTMMIGERVASFIRGQEAPVRRNAEYPEAALA